MEDNSGNWTWAVQDALGSVRSEVDSLLAVQGSRQLTPYLTPFDEVGSFAMPFVGTGEMRDPITGLQYHRARYFNPAMGSWLSLDPFEGIAGRPMSLNGYMYVEGNPVNMVDASGLEPDLSILEEGFGIQQNQCISDSPFGCDSNGNAIAYFITQGFGQEPYDEALCQDWDRSGHCGLDIVSHSDPAWEWVTDGTDLLMQYNDGLYRFNRNQTQAPYKAFGYGNREPLTISDQVFNRALFRMKGFSDSPNTPEVDRPVLRGRKVFALRSGEVEENFNRQYNMLKVRVTQNGMLTDHQIQYIHITDVPPQFLHRGAKIRRGDYIGTYGLFGDGVGSEPHLHISYKYVPLDTSEGCHPYHISPAYGLNLYGRSRLPSHVKKACRRDRLWDRVGRQIEVKACG